MVSYLARILHIYKYAFAYLQIHVIIIQLFSPTVCGHHKDSTTGWPGPQGVCTPEDIYRQNTYHVTLHVLPSESVN